MGTWGWEGTSWVTKPMSCSCSPGIAQASSVFVAQLLLMESSPASRGFPGHWRCTWGTRSREVALNHIYMLEKGFSGCLGAKCSDKTHLRQNINISKLLDSSTPHMMALLLLISGALERGSRAEQCPRVSRSIPWISGLPVSDSRLGFCHHAAGLPPGDCLFF